MTGAEIPVLELPDSAGSLQSFARPFGEGLRLFGFVGLANPGISNSLRDRCYACQREFFSQSEERKLRYQLDGMAGQRGYTRMGVERARTSTTPDLKEFWHVGREWQPSHPRAARYPRNVWPREIEGFREAMLDLFQALEGLGERLLQALAIYLEVADDYFGERSRGGDSILRAIHYPPLTLPTEGVRAAAHEDINLITLLVGAEEPGLQLQTRSGRWLEVPSHPDQVIVNVGDMLQRMTNGVLPSTRHRVINPEAERCSQSRYSMPFFLHLRGDCRLDPVPSCVSEGRPRLLLESITAAEYLWQRLREIGLTTEAGPPSSATSPGSSPS